MLNNTSLTRWNELFPWRDFADLHKEVDRLFSDFTPASNYRGVVQGAHAPTCDIQETDEHYLMRFVESLFND